MKVPVRIATLALAAVTLAAAPLHAQYQQQAGYPQQQDQYPQQTQDTQYPQQGQYPQAGSGAIADTPPPPLPEYDQPEAPGDGYLWTPGYWAWDDQVADYYWVPGTWVMAPEPGLLWTPGYWAYDNGGYAWNGGYWGPHVGFYGGVNYGFGYFGTGYEGGYWNGNRFFYNTSINRINIAFIHNVYSRPLRPEWMVRGPRFAFNGPGGINIRPNRGEEQAFREHRFEATGFQRNQQNFARQDRGQFRSFNHGAPPAAATPRPVQDARGFRNGAVSAQGAPTGAADFNRNRGNFNGDNRGNGNAPQNNDPRNNGGRNGFSGNNNPAPAQTTPAASQPSAPQNTNRGNWNGPGDGRNRPQPPMSPRMPMPADSGNNFGGRNGGGQTPPPQPPPVRATPVPAAPAPVQHAPATPPAQHAPAQPPQGRPAGGNNGGGHPAPPPQNHPAPTGARQFEHK